MRRASVLVLIVYCAAGCTQQDANPEWNPQADLPAWTADAPFYYRPSEELEVVETIGEGIPIFYSPKEYFFIKHPDGYQIPGAPRMQVWSSVDDGNNWLLSGNFGVEQTHFLFKADQDGPHWIRFVGPGQEAVDVPPGLPHRIYMVDTLAPAIDIGIAPPIWRDEEKTERRIYQVGQTITVYWSVSDPHLADEFVRLDMCYARFPQNVVWETLPDSFAPVGSTEVVIPDESVRDGGIRFRIRTIDKAGNVGMGISDILTIEHQRETEILPVRISGKLDPIHQTQGTAGPKLGWPGAGALLRGGKVRQLGWLPEAAADYARIDLEFSYNNGGSWETVAGDVTYGQPVWWTVPGLRSKNCRLRVTGVDLANKKFMLATTERFTVHTAILPAQQRAVPIYKDQ